MINKLSSVNAAYTFSLDHIIHLFEISLTSAKYPTLHQDTVSQDFRLINIIDNATKFIFESICSSLFECDRPLLAFLLTIQINRELKIIDETQWRLFIAGMQMLVSNKFAHSFTTNSNNPFSDKKITASAWNFIC